MQTKFFYATMGLLIGVFIFSAIVVLTEQCPAASVATVCEDSTPEDGACSGTCSDNRYCHITSENKCKCEKSGSLN